MTPKVYLSTACLTGNRQLEHVLRSYLENGVTEIELSAPHPYEPLDQVIALLNRLKSELGANYLVHNYFPIPKEGFVFNPSTQHPKVKEKVYQHADEMIQVALETGSPLCTFHTGYLCDASEKPDGMFAFDHNNPIEEATAIQSSIDLITHMNQKLRANGAWLGIENLFPAKDGFRHSLFCSFEDMKKVLDQIPEEVGLLIDLAHMNVSSNVMGFDKTEWLDQVLENYAHRIYQIHLSENDGQEDLHMRMVKQSWQHQAIQRICEATQGNTFELKVVLEPRGLSVEEALEDKALIEGIISETQQTAEN